MEIHHGTDRTTFVGSHYTVKLARSSPRQFMRYAHIIKKRSGIKGVVNSWQRLSADQHQSLKNMLLHGVAANRREHRLSKNEDVVIPTVSILAGLVNIQPTAHVTDLDHITIHKAFTEQLGPKVTVLGHMLEDTGNIGVDSSGQAKFLDGGSLGLERLIQTQPEALRHALGSLTLRLRSKS